MLCNGEEDVQKNNEVQWITTSTNEIRQTTSLSPWLVFLKKGDAVCNFVDPMRRINARYLMNLPELLSDATIRFSKDGWLLMSKGLETLFFFNPFTREIIKLPDLPKDCNYGFSGICFSSSPTSSDCLVFAITEAFVDQVYIFSIARGDDSWIAEIYQNTMLLPSEQERSMQFKPCLNNPVFYDNAFYCIDHNGILGVFHDFSDWKVLDKLQRPCTSIYRSFLVECEGKLLSVFLGHLGRWVRIFRLDFAEMVWVEIESLGEYMFFISPTACLSAIVPNDCVKNKIYFSRFHGDGILFYSLDTGRYHSSSASAEYSAQDFYNTKEQLNCSWIEPNWSQTIDDEELEWLII